MTTANLQISLNFNQILEVVQQLSDQENFQLNQVLTKDLISKKLTGFLEDFKADELSLELINQEVETIRSEIYAQNSNVYNYHRYQSLDQFFKWTIFLAVNFSLITSDAIAKVLSYRFTA